MKMMVAAAIASALCLFPGSDSQKTLNRQFAVTSAQKIELTGFSGAQLKIRTWEKAEVSVRLDISFSASSQKDEQGFLDEVSIRETRSSDALKIEYLEPEISQRDGRSWWSKLASLVKGSYVSKEIRGEIYVPSRNALTLNARYGTVDVNGVNGALALDGTGNNVTINSCSAISRVNNDYGKVTISNSGGDLKLKTRSNVVVVDQFAGSVDVDAMYSTITVHDATQSLSIHSASATIDVERIKKGVTIQSDYSHITANSIGGMLDIQDKSGTVQARGMDGVRISNEYGNIEVRDVTGKLGKPIILEGQSGMITLTDATGNVQIHSAYGPVKLQRIQGNVDLRTSSNQVQASEIEGDWISVTQYSTVSLNDLKAKSISIRNSGGPVELRLQSVPTAVDVRNDNSKVDLEMPPGFGGDVSLKAVYGSVNTNLPLQNTRSEDGSIGSAIGKVGKGTGKIAIETSSGSLTVTQR